jgi:anti-sigma-K factor RskA
MSDPADIDDLAAEYALGTLDADERASVAARREREPALDTAVRAWELRLSPLAAAVGDRAPSAGLFKRIEQSITQRDGPRIVAAGGEDVIRLRRQLRAWRFTALAGLAAAACLAGLVSVRELTRTQEPQNLVAVFQKDDASPAFVMTVDIASRTLSIRRVAADVPAGKTYQLWIASDRIGPGPQSLGLIESGNGELQRTLDRLDPAVVQSALFGVSLEPAGGSPTGKPTGPVFHTRLISTK